MSKKTFALIGILASLSLISACSGQSMEVNQYNQGKAAFEQQNYQAAYKSLEPLAQAGNPDAQYALGYLYYYGDGVPKNENKAKYWMQRAATQGQKSAEQALVQLDDLPTTS